MIPLQLIGWDCGNKNLSRTILTIDENFKMSIRQDKFDLCNGKKVKDVDILTRISRLVEIVESTPFADNCEIFIEQQPPRKMFGSFSGPRISGLTPNMEIEMALITLHTRMNHKINRVSPTLKSRLLITRQNGIQVLKKPFKGDHKKYAVQNSIEFHAMCGLQYVKTKKEDDNADSLMTILAKIFV